MKKNNKDQFNVHYIPPPIKLRPEEVDLCRKLDNFYKFYKLHKNPSDYYRGAIFASREENKFNPDWLAQATHSFREILYPFFSSKDKKIRARKKKAFEKFGTVGSKLIKDTEIGTLWEKLNKVAHHQLEMEFEDLRQEFVKILNKALAYQVDIHKFIDEILGRSHKPKKDKQLATEIKGLISVNLDAQQYFFSQVNERWLVWLWENGFLEVIKEKIKDPTRGHGLTELNYLIRMAEKVPKTVVDIILEIPVSAETFNPVVVNHFLLIFSMLPAKHLRRVVQKIRDEKWIPLMDSFNQWGFEFEKMLQALANVKNYKSILVLAEAILAVRTKEEIEMSPNGYRSDNPFYFNDLSYIKVFEYLTNINDEYVEQALVLTTKIMGKIVLLGDEAEEEALFPVKEAFPLFDVDFFTLELGEKEHLSQEDDVRELAAAIKVLTQRLIGERCTESNTIRTLYTQYIEALPKSRAMWRLRLFILSLCPEAFKSELKSAFFQLFEIEQFNEIISGAEYMRALQKSFVILPEDDKREYIANVIAYFTKEYQERGKEKENWHKIYGSRILSMIADQLTTEERQQIEKSGFKIDTTYEPSPSIGPVQGGYIVARGPITQEEFEKLPIAEIAKKLRNEWTPEKLTKQNRGEDFLNPLNAEGAGELLRKDIPKRLQDYVNNAVVFFDHGVLDQHYTYSFLCGIQDAIKNNKEAASEVNWSGIIEFLIAIKNSGETESFDREKREYDSYNAWLARWDDVHLTMSDLIQELLKERENAFIDFQKYRNQLFELISYLLNYPDPNPEDEKFETASMKTKLPDSNEYLVSDPYSIAINTIRGRAFQAFASLVYQDGKKLAKDARLKISPDVKKLYERILEKENTRALMFMFGHYLPTFYFRDKAWLQRLLPHIFPIDPEKKYFYIAAWEGYLANALYEEIFLNPEIQKLYMRGLALTDAEYPKQEHFIKLNEGIAIHLALAFMHCEKFGFGHPLFNAFWKKEDPDLHAEFISFLGRKYVSGSNVNVNIFLKKESRSKQRLKDFWDWMLKDYENPRPFAKFGFWISLEKDIFEPIWLAERVKNTLKKTKGALDWDYGLVKSINQFAKEAPEEALEITRLYLLEGGLSGMNHRITFHIDNEWSEALKVLHNNPATQSGTYTLINDLIQEGGSAFWMLKKIIEP